jgi:CelD/BcsL family acetyltransferase involved in cellulose biosynthesis
MHVESSEFDNQFTIGETKALLAPLVQQSAEDIKGYIIITLGGDEHAAVIGLISNDEHPECRIRLLAKAIELTAGDINA